MNLDAQWIVGFIDGEGHFGCSITKYQDMRLKTPTTYVVSRPVPEFVVVQHKRDIKVLHALKNHFGCGRVCQNHGDRYCYKVRTIEHLTEKIIPFFEKHSLKTIKRIQFPLFKKIVFAMAKKEHLTESGLEQIKIWSLQLKKRQT